MPAFPLRAVAQDLVSAAEPAPLLVGDVMVALGDSIAAGIGAPHVDEGCMRLLAARLRELQPELELAHLAIPSESSASMLQPGGQLERAEAAIREALDGGRSVGPITLSVGGNDILEASLVGHDEALRQFEENLAAILRRLSSALRPSGRELAGVCAVQTVYNPFEALPSDEADLMAPRRSDRGGFNAAIHRLAANAGVRVVDVSGLFRGRSLELTWVRTGDIHPTGEGHELIAREYVRVGGWPLG